MNLDEMSSREKTRVTVEVDGERREYTKNFIVMHMTDEGGEVLGCVGPIGLVRAVDMLMDSISNVMEKMTDGDKMMVEVLLMQRLKESIEND